MNDNEKFNWIRLARTPRVGPVTFQRLIDKFGSATLAIDQIISLKKSTSAEPLSKLKLATKSSIEKEMKLVQMCGASFICSAEPSFPFYLKNMDPPPPLICVKGRAALMSEPCVSIVGSRNASAAGRKMAHMLANDLGESGYMIVSGLARGIDRQVHESALETGTIAVIAGGIDTYYPPEHRDLQEKIFEKGLVICEAPFGYQARARDFPKRNAIIAGLSAATIVVEAAEKSGSLITARLALELNREVMAVPGSPLDPRARGTNRLIKQGAHLVSDAQDVLALIAAFENRSLDFEQNPQDLGERDDDDIKYDQFDNLQEKILSLVSPVPIQLDELIRQTGADPHIVTSMVVELEINGEVETLTGGSIIKI